MSYQVLARKWRPKRFADLVGQEHVVGALRNALAGGRLHHAYLLTGTRGVGKTTIARILAKSLNCEHPEHGEPCGECSQCVQIDADRHVDVVEIDAASNTGIDNIREVLENAQYAPSIGRYKVYIIDEVHMLSKSAFNAMLKTLEEPPEHVKFILATTDPQKVPVTVLSRCLQFVLRNMTPQQIDGHLQFVLQQENVAFEEGGLQLLARAANGSMRDALSLLDQAIALGEGRVLEQTVRTMLGAVDRQFVYRLLSALANGDAAALMQQTRQILAEGAGFAQVLQEMALVLQQIAMVQLLPSAADDLQDALSLRELAQAMTAEQVQLFYQCLIHGKNDLPLAPDEQAGVMMTLLRMLALRPLGMSDVGINQAIELPQSPESTPQTNTPNRTDHHGAPLQDALSGDAQASSASITSTEPSAANSASKLQDALPDNKEPSASCEPADIPPLAEYEKAQPIVDDSDDSNEPPPWEGDERWAAPSAMTDFADVPEQSESTFNTATTAVAESVSSVSAETTADAILPQPEEAQKESRNTGELTVDVAAANTEPEPEILALNAANWPHIVERIAPQLSAARMLAQHAAFAAFDENSGELHLKVAHEGALIQDRQYLHRLSEVLSAFTGRLVSVTAEDGTDNLETPHARAQRQEQERRQQGLQILQQDRTAQQLTALFEGEWLPESVCLKPSS